LFLQVLAARRRVSYLSGNAGNGAPAIWWLARPPQGAKPRESLPMTTFNDREKAFEDKYKHDQDLQFKVEVRRNKLLGLWVAELLGLSGADAEAYAKEVVSADFEEPGDADVIRKIQGDVQPKNIDLSEHRLRKKMDELVAVAKEQIMSE
jgi:hypothetical protein